MEMHFHCSLKFRLYRNSDYRVVIHYHGHRVASAHLKVNNYCLRRIITVCLSSSLQVDIVTCSANIRTNKIQIFYISKIFRLIHPEYLILAMWTKLQTRKHLCEKDTMLMLRANVNVSADRFIQELQRDLHETLFLNFSVPIISYMLITCTFARNRYGL